jgi:hypothetical protein
MHRETLTREANECRKRAREFFGRPEEPFLLKLASEFERLAKEPHLTQRGRHTDDER